MSMQIIGEGIEDEVTGCLGRRPPSRARRPVADQQPEVRGPDDAVAVQVAKTLASMRLAEIRRAIGLTKIELSETLDLGQGNVSKLERQADMYLSTLRRYVEALGGTLHLTAEFPDGRRIEIEGIADAMG